MIHTMTSGEHRTHDGTARRRDVIVVGGGQAGLATGYFLAQQGRDLAILEAADEPAAAWRERRDPLTLFTSARYCGLPGVAGCPSCPRSPRASALRSCRCTAAPIAGADRPARVDRRRGGAGAAVARGAVRGAANQRRHGRRARADRAVPRARARQDAVVPRGDGHRAPEGDGPVTYACPMHPDVVSDVPGHCPERGMKLLASQLVGEAPAHGHDDGHGHSDHDHGDGHAHATADGIEWEDDMVEVNRMTTPSNMRWKLVYARRRRTARSTGGCASAIRSRSAFATSCRRPPDAPPVPILLEVSNVGRWMAHCHIAEHHESGMMFSFDVAPREGEALT